jgi:hypothetical protein
VLKFVIILNFLFLTACTSLSVQIPGNRFITPESQGTKAFQGRVDVGVHGGAEVELVDDKYSAAPSTTPTISEESGAQLSVELNLLPHIDTYYIMNYNSFNSLGLKVQVIGDNLKEAKESNFSTAIGGGALLTGSAQKSSDENSVTADSDTHFSGYEYFLLLGYRTTESVLLYAGPWMTNYKLASILKRTSAGVTTTTLDTKGEGDQRSIILGLQTGKQFQLNLESAFTKTNYKKTSPIVEKAESKSFFVWGASLSYSW